MPLACSTGLGIDVGLTAFGIDVNMVTAFGIDVNMVTALQLLALFSMVKVVTASLYSLCLLPMLEIVTVLFFFFVLALFNRCSR